MLSPAYLAGFIDGEGCFNFTRSRTVVSARILIANTNLEILQQIQKQYGGDIKEIPHRRSHWKKGYTLRLANRKCMNLLNDIYPYLVVKKQQADVFLKFDSCRPGKGHKWDVNIKSKILDELSNMNRKGNHAT